MGVGVKNLGSIQEDTCLVHRHVPLLGKPCLSQVLIAHGLIVAGCHFVILEYLQVGDAAISKTAAA